MANEIDGSKPIESKPESWWTRIVKFHKENKDEYNANYVKELKSDHVQREYQWQIMILKIAAKIATYMMLGRFLDYLIKLQIKILIPGLME